MSIMESDVFDTFKSIGVADEKAMKAATALSKRDADISGTKAEIAVLKWITGFGLALNVAILLKLFVH